MAIQKLITPVVSTLDERDFRKVIRYTSLNGTDIIFSLGTTGEEYELGIKDKKDVIRVSTDEVMSINQSSPLELACGVTGNDLFETIDLVQYAEEKKVDYAVLMPLKLKRRHQGLGLNTIDIVDLVLEKTNNIPIILYNYPDRTGNENISKEDWTRFARYERVIALKDSSGRLQSSKEYLQKANGNASVYAGDEITGLNAMDHYISIDGIVAGGSNILPVAWAKATKRESYDGVSWRDIAKDLKWVEGFYSENPIGAFKYILQKKRVISDGQVFDPDLVVSRELQSNLDMLMSSTTFRRYDGWNQKR